MSNLAIYRRIVQYLSMPDAAFRLWTVASAAPFLLLLDSSCCRCGSCCWFLLASDGFCCLLLACACSCWLLPAPAGFCLLLLACAYCCWFLPAAGSSFLAVTLVRLEVVRKGARVLLDLDRTSIEPRSDPAWLCRNPACRYTLPGVRYSNHKWSCIWFHIALPIGSVPSHMCVDNGKSTFHIHKNHAGYGCEWIWRNIALTLGKAHSTRKESCRIWMWMDMT